MSEPAERQVVAERMTVGFIPKAVVDLAELVRITGLRKVDLINRAVTLYAFVAKQLVDGNEILVRNRQGDVEKVHII